MEQYYGVDLAETAEMAPGLTYVQVGETNLKAIAREHGLEEVLLFAPPGAPRAALILLADGEITPGVGEHVLRSLERYGLPTGVRLQPFASAEDLVTWARSST